MRILRLITSKMYFAIIENRELESPSLPKYTQNIHYISHEMTPTTFDNEEEAESTACNHDYLLLGNKCIEITNFVQSDSHLLDQ